MKRKIQLNDEEIIYDLSLRSNSRTIRAKVVFGELKVTAPKYCPIRDIEVFLKRNADLLLSEMTETQLAEYIDHGYVYILGHRVEIIHQNMHINKCVLRNGKIYVYGVNIEKCIETFLQNSLKQYASKYIQQFVSHHREFPMPEITYKRTTGRYGACYYTQNKVCLNPVIIHYKKEFIDSVMIHEMCHFKYHDHSTYFYREVYKYMPDYDMIHGGSKTYD